MKTALFSLLAVILLGLVSLASGRMIDAAEFSAVFCALGLFAWTVEQYSRNPRPLSATRPIRLPAPVALRQHAPRAARLAA